MPITPIEQQQTTRFSPGQIVATPGALDAMNTAGIQPMDLIMRHIQGDWGVIPPEDANANLAALASGARILSSYPLEGGARIWIITEAENDQQQRECTTCLLPEEY